MISMWEFAMDGGRYDAPDFRNRHLTLPALDDDCVQPESLLSRSALQINATIRCISEAHSLLDCFIQLPNDMLQKAPNVLFVRPLYAIVALMKADYAVGTDAEGIGEVLQSESLKVDFYLDTVVRLTESAVGPQKCRVPSHWLFVLKNKLKAWHDEHQQWRKEGGHLKRNSPPKEQNPEPDVSSTARTCYDPVKLMDNLNPTVSMPASTSTVTQPGPPPPNFGIGNAFPPWPTSGMGLTGADATPGLPEDQSAFGGGEMGDFSAAFQNGDLYLWNDVNDSFGGWIPQGGSIYSDMQFGAMNNPGL